jgi:hypothetical protein
MMHFRAPKNIAATPTPKYGKIGVQKLNIGALFFFAFVGYALICPGSYPTPLK